MNGQSSGPSIGRRICEICGATWDGPEDDACHWCEKRYEREREWKRQRLLFPEWLSWGERFDACNDIDRIVWAETRGFTGDYRGKWERELSKAVTNGILTDSQRALAVKRNAKWISKTHSGKHGG